MTVRRRRDCAFGAPASPAGRSSVPTPPGAPPQAKLASVAAGGGGAAGAFPVRRRRRCCRLKWIALQGKQS